MRSRTLQAVLLVSLLALITYVAGLFLPETRESSTSVIINAPKEVVWTTITDLNTQTTWRGNLKGVTIHNAESGNELWTEHMRLAPSARFRTIEKVPGERIKIEFSALGRRLVGTAVLNKSAADETIVKITDKVRISNPFIRLLVFIFYNPEKILNQYVQDLKAHAENQ